MIHPETKDMAKWLKSFCLPRYDEGHQTYNTKNIDCTPLANITDAAEESADILFYLRQAIIKLGPRDGRLRVYIAGPYRGDSYQEIDDNIALARKAMKEILEQGHTPFCPHTMTAQFERYAPEIPDDVYLITDLDWLIFCHVILLLDGWEDSCGATLEMEVAKRLGLQVIHTAEELPANRYSTVSLSHSTEGNGKQDGQETKQWRLQRG